jgi:hypothetical protein
MNESDLRRQVTYMIRHPEEYEQEEVVFLVSGLYFNFGKDFTWKSLRGIKEAESILRELDDFASSTPNEEAIAELDPPLENVIWNPTTHEVHVVEDDDLLYDIYADDLEEALNSNSFLKILTPTYRLD